MRKMTGIVLLYNLNFVNYVAFFPNLWVVSLIQQWIDIAIFTMLVPFELYKAPILTRTPTQHEHLHFYRTSYLPKSPKTNFCHFFYKRFFMLSFYVFFYKRCNLNFSFLFILNFILSNFSTQPMWYSYFGYISFQKHTPFKITLSIIEVCPTMQI